MVDLEFAEYERYGRQMILPEIGKPGQIKLKAVSVLLVGAGGLGCPAIAYLAGAGVGHLGIIDGDTVNVSNCHRQILYSATHEGRTKVEVAAAFVRDLNPLVNVTAYPERLTATNVERVFSDYEVVLDCTDNQATRYLISDACVLLGLPLVSGSALKTEGQLAIYNYLEGPCYRCIFPEPTPAELVESCGDAGILGPVVGMIGVMQALETIKLITRECRGETKEDRQHACTLTLFSAFADIPWRTIKLRKKAINCKACGKDSSMSFRSLRTSRTNDKTARKQAEDANIEIPRLSAPEMTTFKGLVLDVRNSTQYEISHLPGSTNVPIETLQNFGPDEHTRQILVVCRNGVDSRAAAVQLTQRYPHLQITDLQGGLKAYANIERITNHEWAFMSDQSALHTDLLSGTNTIHLEVRNVVGNDQSQRH